MKRITCLLITLAIIAGICLGIYQIPEVQSRVDCEVIAWRIERSLKKKYGIEFDVKRISVEKGNTLWGYSNRYPDCGEDVYTFSAYFGEERYDSFFDKEVRSYISGIVDDDMNILADSYPYYLYRNQLMDTLEEMVEDDFSGKIIALPFMDPGDVITLDKDAESFERFYENTHTYEQIWLLVDEICTEAEMETVYHTLMEEKFPFSVCIKQIANDEMAIVRASGVESLRYTEGEEVDAWMNKFCDGHWNWRESLIYVSEYVYLWYKVDGE